jgi:trimeric autotransporter adhesin
MTSFRVTLTSVLCLSVTAMTLSAQTYQGGVRGAVRDANAVIPGADVALVNEETGLTRAMVTNAVGEYAFPNVLPGVYLVRASLQGFKTLESRGIRIGTQEFLTLDLRLDVGEVKETITVTGATPVIETTNASVGTLLDRQALETLPNAGRNPFVLSVIAPNVVPTGVPQFVRMQDQNATAMLSLGGGPRRANNFLLDGVPITDLFNRAAIIPSIEAVEEVKIQVSTYDAELGRTGGGVFNTTHKSGSNAWRGSALFLDRPEWGTGKLFFTRKAGQPKPETYYRLWGGSLGGPVLRNRTFFWASTEGYKTQTTANQVISFPTPLERRGDYSQSFDQQGRLIVIHDPLTTRPDPDRPGQFIRDPFPGNVIPPNRLNAVARNFVDLLPLPTEGRSITRTSLPVADLTNQATVKVDHRLTNRQTISGLFAWYHSKEPAPQFYGTPGDPNALFQPRTVNVVAINHIMVPSDRIVLALRYGYLRFRDDFASVPTDPRTLGFSPAFAGAITGFPRLTASPYGSGPLLNGGLHTDSTSYSHSASASLSRLAGRHTFKTGADYRLIGMRLFAPGDVNGTFNFTSAFTQGPNPNVGSTASGDALASLLLGFPASGSFNIGTPNDLYTHYVGGYVQDDLRLRSNVSVNFGVRYDFEQGLRERNNAFTVGFDRERAFPIQVPGLALKGGLMYAGVDGYPTHQGNPSRFNFAPRAGVAWSLNSKTVVRGGYGLFWAPSQIAQAFSQAALGTRGFTASTTYVASDDGGLTPCPSCSLTNPFPAGLETPQGAALGLQTGVGGDIDFVDQSGGSAYVHQYSVDVKRELPGRMAASVGYLGSRSEGLTVGGTVDGTVNINQVDSQYLTLGGALQDQVPNPFFGIPDFGSLATTRTIERRQVLRPFPQFRNVLAHRVSTARAQYDALAVSLERRQHEGWGAYVNYTFSVRKDNQFGEGNAFVINPGGAVDSFDLEREYGRSLLDTPHRLNISGTVELPFGAGRRWLTSGGVWSALVGGWALSAVGMYQSGFPITVIQGNNNSNLLGSGQRPNVVPGIDPKLPGSPEDNYDPTCNCILWLNPAAWSAAAPFTFGNAPRADTRVRTPLRTNWDIAVHKTHPIGSARLTIRAEIINAFDNPAFAGPRPGYGAAGGVFGTIAGVNGFPRTLQLQARVAW